MKVYNFNEKNKKPVAQLEDTAIKAKIIFEVTSRCYTPGDTDAQNGKLSFADKTAFHQKKTPNQF